MWLESLSAIRFHPLIGTTPGAHTGGWCAPGRLLLGAPRAPSRSGHYSAQHSGAPGETGAPQNHCLPLRSGRHRRVKRPNQAHTRRIPNHERGISPANQAATTAATSRHIAAGGRARRALGPNRVLPSGLSIPAGRTATRKAPASALLRALRARELFPEPLADAPWKTSRPGLSLPRPLGRSISSMPRRRRNWRRRSEGGFTLSALALYMRSSMHDGLDLGRSIIQRANVRDRVRQPNSGLRTGARDKTRRANRRKP
jgi:hypothetical protein